MDRTFRFMRANANTLTAINAALGIDDGASVPNANGLGRTPFQAGCASFAFARIQRHGMLVCTQNSTSLFERFSHNELSN